MVSKSDYDEICRMPMNEYFGLQSLNVLTVSSFSGISKGETRDLVLLLQEGQEAWGGGIES